MDERLAELFCEVGERLGAQGEHDRAVQWFRQGIPSFPAATSWIAYGVALHRRVFMAREPSKAEGRLLLRAVRALRRGLALERGGPRRPGLYVIGQSALGDIYSGLMGALPDRPDLGLKALRAYRRALRLSPENPAILLDVAVLFSRLGRLRRAVPMAERALGAGGPTGYRAHYVLGHACHGLAREDPPDVAALIARAVRVLRCVVSGGPGTPLYADALYELGDLQLWQLLGPGAGDARHEDIARSVGALRVAMLAGFRQPQRFRETAARLERLLAGVGSSLRPKTRSWIVFLLRQLRAVPDDDDGDL